MKILKGFALSLLSFLLFLSLSIFGLAFMLNSTILNPNFITSELDRLDVSSLVGEILSEQTGGEGFSEEFETALVNTVAELEPLIKEQVSAATNSIYDYLLGKSESIDLALTLRNSLLSKDFALSVVDKLDISSLAGDLLSKQLTEQIPAEIQQYVTDESLDKVISELKPWLKEQINAAADPVLDYLVGKRQSFSVVISLEPAKASLKDTLKEAFLKLPPPELAGVPQAELEQHFDQFYGELAAQMPSTLEINQGLLGADMPAEIAEALAEAEIALEQAKQYVGYFQLGYKLLIGFIVLLILGIILISRQVRDITRHLGIPCLTYGALWYAGIFIAKHLARTQIALPEIPPSLQTWMPQFLNDFLAPLEMLSLGLLIGGIALLIASFVYKPRQPEF